MSRGKALGVAAALAAGILVTVAAAAPGDLDKSFGNGGVVTTAVAPGAGFDFQNGLAVQGNGRIVEGGSSNMGVAAGGGNWRLTRYKSNGTLDPTFGTGGVVTTNMSAVGGDDEHVWSLTLQPDGKIVAVGHARTAAGGRDWALARYNGNGTLDPTFGTGGAVVLTIGAGTGDDRLFEVVVDAQGKILAGGHATMSAAEGGRNFAVARFNADGTLDTSFNPGGPTPGIVVTPVAPGARVDHISDVYVDATGRIVGTGFADLGPGAGGVDLAFARYLPDGALDNSFDGDGKLTLAATPGDNFENINALVIDGSGKIVGGGAVDGTANIDWVLVRLNADGSLDGSFDGDGIRVLPVGASDDNLEDLIIQPTGKIAVGGSSSASGLGVDDDFTVGRFNADGSLDTTFGSGGIAVTPMGPGSDLIFAVAAQGDGKLVTAGECDLGATGTDVCLARYKAGD